MAVALLLPGCSGSGGGTALAVRVNPGPVQFDDASAITIAGADPAHPVTMEASARDGQGTTWTSRADFVPRADGTVDLAQAAPHSGSYTGAHATGLIWSMTAGDEHSGFIITGGAMQLTFTASQTGRTSTSATQRRSFAAPGVTRTPVGNESGFVGEMFTPSPPAAQAGAVLVFGGSEGGLGVSAILAEALASHGHPALALAYFGAPGLPQTLANIPLEYFARTLTWLNKQPGIDPHQTAVVGASRGSEAALLLGASYPELVHAVLATSPTSSVHSGYPDTSKPAWTWHGKPLPNDPIPVDRIRGPVLLLCGTDDGLWPSCQASEVLKKELAGTAVTEIREQEAGHLVDFFIPNLPLASTTLVSRR